MFTTELKAIVLSPIFCLWFKTWKLAQLQLYLDNLRVHPDSHFQILRLILPSIFQGTSDSEIDIRSIFRALTEPTLKPLVFVASPDYGVEFSDMHKI